MHGSRYWRSMLMALLLIPGAVPVLGEGESLQTGWMELVKGSRDSKMGSELRSIEPGEKAGEQKITISIPKSAIEHPEDIEEVLVVGRKPEEFEFPLDVRYEWLDDYDNDNYGLVIYLSRESHWPIRLYLNSAAGFID
jgi:hypothetical protein